MRKIKKDPTEPFCLTEFIQAQLSIDPVVNLTYDDFGNPNRRSFREHLTNEQYGICGYTGVPVDERLCNFSPSKPDVRYTNHIEHLKCQATCKEEVIASGEEYGHVLGDDLNYHNMIAALEIRGSKQEHFGAVLKKNKHLPIWPTHVNCDEKFTFQEDDGLCVGLTSEAIDSEKILKLNHDTLKGWRKSAIDAWLDPTVITTCEDYALIVAKTETPEAGKLPEFAYVINAIARTYLS